MLPLSFAHSIETQSLEGEWRFALDLGNSGIEERWFDQTLDGRVLLPGDLTSQGIGNPITVDTPWVGSVFDASYYKAERFAPYREPDNIKVPFWLQPELYYAGPAWYQRKITFDDAWVGKRVTLSLERPHWKTTVWLDGREIGSDVSLSTVHVYDLGVVVAAGVRTLTIRVDNSSVVDVGENSHSVSDHTQGNWNGIVGRIELAVSEPVWVDGLRVYPDADTNQVRIEGTIRNATGKSVVGELGVAVVPLMGAAPLMGEAVSQGLDFEGESIRFEAVYSFSGDASLWSEFTPELYELGVELKLNDRVESNVSKTRFGFRKIEADGRQLRINGRKLFLRGTLECAIFPKTGYPPTDVASWQKVYAAVQAHGLNHVRFHSWCPPEAAFVAADEMGVYLQVEAASWPNQSTTLGDGAPIDEWIEAETKRVLAAYGNHASFVLMASGNEPGGERHEEWLQGWVARRKASDDRRLYTGGAGWPQISENEFHVTSDPRIQQWGDGLKSRINSLPPETMTDYRDYIEERAVPVVSHEIGQWCVYPNFEEMDKYTGYLKPKNFEIFREWLEAKEMGHLAKDFVMASGKLQALCYKEDIESALRTSGMGGFQLLDLHDFPGQGTALVGVLDPFWEEKGYISPAEYGRFCNAVVPLARFAKRVFTQGERVTVGLELSHYGADTFRSATPVWKLINEAGVTVRSGELASRDLPAEGLLTLGELELDFAGLASPARYRFELAIAGTEFANDWNLWVYPESKDSNVGTEVQFVRELDDGALKALEGGGTIVLQIDPKQVQGDTDGPVQLGFSTTFWNTSWTGGQAPHTMGILCNPEHAALAEFPTEFHSDWQWWYVITNSAAMILDDLPAEIKPIVRVVDDWFHVRRLALAFEVKVGKGRLIVTSVDLDAEENPVVAQFRKSLLDYAGEAVEADLVEVDAAAIRSLYR